MSRHFLIARGIYSCTMFSAILCCERVFFLNNIITPFRGLCSNVAAGFILNKFGKQCYNIV